MEFLLNEKSSTEWTSCIVEAVKQLHSQGAEEPTLDKVHQAVRQQIMSGNGGKRPKLHNFLNIYGQVKVHLQTAVREGLLKILITRKGLISYHHFTHFERTFDTDDEGSMTKSLLTVVDELGKGSCSENDPFNEEFKTSEGYATFDRIERYIRYSHILKFPKTKVISRHDWYDFKARVMNLLGALVQMGFIENKDGLHYRISIPNNNPIQTPSPPPPVSTFPAQDHASHQQDNYIVKAKIWTTKPKFSVDNNNRQDFDHFYVGRHSIFT